MSLTTLRDVQQLSVLQPFALTADGPQCINTTYQDHNEYEW